MFDETFYQHNRTSVQAIQKTYDYPSHPNCVKDTLTIRYKEYWRRNGITRVEYLYNVEVMNIYKLYGLLA